MEIIESREVRYGKGQRARLLIKALSLPLLAIFFIALSLASLLFLPSGVTRVSIWVHGVDSDLGKRIAAVDFGTPVHAVPVGTGSEESPSNCTGNVWQIVTETNAREGGDILHGRLASAGIIACSGLSYEFNMPPTNSSGVARLLIGWPHFLLLVCGIAAAIFIYRRHGDLRRSVEPTMLVKVCAGVIGAVLVCLFAELVARAFQGDGQEYIPSANTQKFSILPLVAAWPSAFLRCSGRCSFRDMGANKVAACMRSGAWPLQHMDNFHCFWLISAGVAPGRRSAPDTFYATGTPGAPGAAFGLARATRS